MSTSSLAITGSIADRLNAVAARIRGLESPADKESWRPQLVRALEFVADRIALLRRRGGVAPNVGVALTGLETTARVSQAFPGPGGAALQEETLGLVDRIRGGRPP